MTENPRSNKSAESDDVRHRQTDVDLVKTSDNTVKDAVIGFVKDREHQDIRAKSQLLFNQDSPSEQVLKALSPDDIRRKHFEANRFEIDGLTDSPDIQTNESHKNNNTKKPATTREFIAHFFNTFSPDKEIKPESDSKKHKTEALEDSFTSFTMLAFEAKNNQVLEPVSLLREHADSLADGKEKQDLIELSRKQAKEISPNLNAWYERKELQEKLDTAESKIFQAACDRFGKEHIERVDIDKGNIGQAISLLLFGPDTYQLMGKENAARLGRQLMVFGIAPIIGVGEAAKQKLQDNPSKLFTDGTTNIFSGTAIGVILESVNPVVLGVVSTACLGIFGKQVLDELTLPENKKRNEKLVSLAKSIDSFDDIEMIGTGRQVKEILAPKIYEIGFDLVTGGVAIGEGRALKHELSDAVSGVDIRGFTKNVREIGDDVLNELQGLLTSIDKSVKTGLEPAGALVNGTLHGNVSHSKYELLIEAQLEEFGKEDLSNFMVGSNDFFDGLAKQIKNWKIDSQRKKSIEKLKTLDIEDAAKIAAQELVKEPPKLDERAIKKLLGQETDAKEYLRRMSEHVSYGREVLLRHAAPEDILDLHRHHYSIDFSDYAITAKNKLGRSAEIPGSLAKVEELLGITFSEDRTLHVPLRIFDEHQKKWIYNSENMLVDLNAEFHQPRLDGTIRHELAQALGEIRNWTYRKGASPIGGKTHCKYLYDEEIKAVKTAEVRLLQAVKLKKSELELSGLSYEQINSNKEYLTLWARLRFCQNYSQPNRVGIEQVMSDLYAIRYGGSAATKAFDQSLTIAFKNLFNFLEHNKWFRGDDE
ncbi:MAG: hypothetical protein IPG59_00055 [Candidatus Melainabacteria bacterium]|nr:MAG: hypothetical protein IPG59_00055 [Candidatus Melainabacteria bacterium]